MPDVSKGSRQSLIAMLLCALAALTTFLIFQGRLINHDTAWFLISVERWHEGSQLYRDIFEVNPPINFYFTLPVKWLADMTGLALSDAQYAVSSTMIGLIVGWCYLIIARSGHTDVFRQLALITMVWVALVIPALKHFAQRDHLLMIFLMPWAISLAFHANGAYGWRGGVRGAFAALGICLKPYFLFFPVLASCALILRERSFRPLFSAFNIAIVTVGTVYVVFVRLVHPSYFSDIVPIGMLTYGDYGLSNERVLRNIGFIQALSLILLLLECLRQRTSLPRLGVFLSLLVVAVLSYFLQFTGYTYQAIPFQAIGITLCAFLMTHSSEGQVFRSAIICFFVLLLFSARGGGYRSSSAQIVIDAQSKDKTISSISTISSHVFVGPIVGLELNAEWENRYPALWPVPGIVNGLAEGDCIRSERDCVALRSLAIQIRANVLEDLQKGKAVAITFDKRSGYFDEPGFSFEAFLRKSEELSNSWTGTDAGSAWTDSIFYISKQVSRDRALNHILIGKERPFRTTPLERRSLRPSCPS